MMPEPLHPAIVHFPIVLAFLLPVVAAVALWSIGRGARPRTAWLAVVAVAAGLTLSSWVAVETGEQQEEVVEEVVSRSALHDHEEGAELFLALTVVALLAGSAGLLGGRLGRLARVGTVVIALGVVGAGYRVGHSGGELVYRHGAATAYSGAPASPTTDGTRETRSETEDERGG